MNAIIAILIHNKRTVIRTVLIVVGILVMVSLVGLACDHKKKPRSGETLLKAKVDRVASGHKVKLGTDEHLIYAGIRAPYPHEPLFEQATQRNVELVQDRKIRLRFDQEERDEKGYYQAYVFRDGEFINETLVRDGLAFVRLTPTTRRFSDRLLTAQGEARKNKRGLWKDRVFSTEEQYPADPKYGNFHRPTCEEVGKIKPERLVVLKSCQDAYSQGFAPCSKCDP